MKKLLKHKSKLQAILTTSRPIIILALALVAAISVVAPAYAIPILGLIIPAWVLWTLGSTAIIGGIVFAEEILTKTAQGITKIFLELIQVLVAVLQPILVPVIKTILSFGLGYPNFLLDSLITNEIWSIALTIANAAFLLVLLIAAIAIITRANTGIYNLKKFLGGFIMAVALCNFSLIIVKAMVSLGDQLTHTVLSAGTGLGVNLSPSAVGAPPGAPPEGVLLTYFTNMISMKIDPRGWTIPNLAISIVELAIFLITVWIMIKLGLILLERVVRLFAAAVMAPLIFAGSLLPNFQKTAAGWWENTIKWILVLPIMVAFLIVGLKFFSLAGADQPSKMLLIHDYLAPTFIQDAIHATAAGKPFTTPETKAVSEFACALMGLFIFWMAGMVSSSLKLGSVLGGLVETPQKAIALGQKAYKTSADVVTGKNPVTRFAYGKAVGAWQAGQAGMLGKRAQAFTTKTEAARQRAGTRGGFWDTAAGMIVNPAGVQKYREGIAKRNLSGELVAHAAGDVEKRTEYLDTLAQQYATGKRNWNQLNKGEQEAIMEGEATRIDDQGNDTGKKISRATASQAQKGKAWLDKAGGSVAYYQKEARKEIDIYEIGDIDELGRNLDDKDRGKALKAAMDLMKVARSPRGAFSEEEKIKALEYLSTHADELQKYKMRVPRTYRTEKGETKEVDKSTSDVERIRLDQQQEHIETRVDQSADPATGKLSDVDLSDNLTATAEKSALDTLQPTERGDLSVSINDILNDKTKLAKFNEALQAKDDTKRHEILGRELAGDIKTTDQRELVIKLMQEGMNAEAIKARIQIHGRLKPNATIDTVIEDLRELQQNRLAEDTIIKNQTRTDKDSVNNYRVVTDAKIKNLSAKPIRVSGKGGSTFTIKDRADLQTVLDTMKKTIEDEVKTSPNLKGDYQLDQAIGKGRTDAMYDFLNNLGVGTGIDPATLTVDEASRIIRLLQESIK